MNVPEDLLYTSEHEWISTVGEGRVRIGITDYAQDQLGDVVFVELPSVGKEFEVGDLMAEIESTKSVGEVYAPVAGTVTEVNQNVADQPDLVNSSPYGDGWLVELETGADLHAAGFLDSSAYRELTE
jgi:glycine cleavage system H protein